MHASFSDLLVVVLVRIFDFQRGQLVAVLIVAGEGKVKIASLAKKKLNCMLGKEKFELQAWQRNSSPLLVLELLQVTAPLLLLLVHRLETGQQGLQQAQNRLEHIHLNKSEVLAFGIEAFT